MNNIPFFSLGTIKANKGILIPLRHNKRELQWERGADNHIDVQKTPLNYCLFGNQTSSDLDKHVKKRLIDADIKMRRNAVIALEIVFSLPVKYHSRDNLNFFEDCMEWTKRHFEGELLSFDVHLDEAAPHAHALILPLVNGRLQGSEIRGNRTDFINRQKSFYEEVARHYGLTKSVRLGTEQKNQLIRKIFSALKNDTIMQSKIWPFVRNHIAESPEPYAQLLAISPSPKKSFIRHFVDIARSSGRGVFEK